MKKYYIGFLVLLGVCLMALVYTVIQAGGAKADRLTDQTAEKISEKMDTYIADHGSPPQSLKDIGINDAPDTVTYQKIGSDQYKVCLDYHEASSGFDAGWAALFGGAFGASADDMSGQSSGNGYYFDSSVIYSHKKGQNCQTVKPYSYNYDNGQQPLNYNLDQSSPSASAAGGCSDYSSLNAYGYMKVTAVNPSLNSISFSGYTTGSSSAGSDVTLVYDSDTLFCDSANQQTTISGVKAGSYVEVFTKSSSDKTIARIDIY